MNVWESAAGIVSRHLAAAPKLETLMETLPRQWTAAERRRCRHLVYGTVRHRALLLHAVDGLLRGPTRPNLRAALLVAAFELLEGAEDAPKIVHHAVARTRSWLSAGEARVANAVLRRVPALLAAVLEKPARSPAELALRYSHPEWLVERWIERWGADDATRLLQWNQQPAPMHARVLAPTELPPGFEPTAWPMFFRLERPEWSEVERLLETGSIYLQDPAPAIAPELLAVEPGETVLDVCAAPGGKSLQLADFTGPAGRVVAVDLPGPRLERLRQNLARYPALVVDVIGLDARELTPDALVEAGAPAMRFDAVLVDVPCSNTGVLRHRVDVKWRLRPEDLDALPELQLALLQRAALCVRPGGRLVYSTCSLEPEENEAVVSRFLDEASDAFVLEQSVASVPWESRHDGAGAFLLRHGGEPVGMPELSPRFA